MYKCVNKLAPITFVTCFTLPMRKLLGKRILREKLGNQDFITGFRKEALQPLHIVTQSNHVRS